MNHSHLWVMGKGLARLGLVAALSTLVATPLHARRQRMVMGPEAQQQTNRLTSEIQWHRSLEEARAVAAHEGKLVFWVHMLGRIEGST